ncbi:hypothetical protein [Lysinibacillus sp. NPDC056232]|uniref:hypothetical protein n=1 Tax=Lysinibacillus sp. NPDC056232 TaxID=3345756 RepID=UPI0035DD67D8
MKENITQPVPKLGHSCYLDMISTSSSPEAKANAARRYAEMMIDLFLSEKAKERLGEDKFKKLGLGDQIKEIRNDFNKEVVDALFNIKNIGDRGSHYSPDKQLSEEEVNKISKTALGLFTLILIDYFKKNRFDKTIMTPTIFSTLFPEVRANVLSRLLNNGILTEDYDKGILHKYILALVKSRKTDKAKKLLENKYKKGLIEIDFYKQEEDSILQIEEGMKKEELPVPKKINDCKRNFDAVINSLDQDERIKNKELIKIISTLLHEISPSEFGSSIPNKRYPVQVYFNIED